jgi:UDP-N-acetyl-D-glucosamine dehydrogenase
MPDYVVGKVADGLNHERKAINGSHVLILGVAYKRDVGDARESPALDIIHLLQQRGADVAYNDPYVHDLSQEGFPLRSTRLTVEALQTADCVIVITDHSDYDWDWIAANSRLLIDTRNAIKHSGPCRVLKL